MKYLKDRGPFRMMMLTTTVIVVGYLGFAGVVVLMALAGKVAGG